ncbi:DUF1848 domain-containing protein [Abyssisolibacter fermentans]|uniref:DUF1848 domain-containing protein n=1 Tax=Abyssisolibacter fermentans TaxID=1766203 RepID=UPI0008364EA6|nr:DUF1848 domain-containing protein [Abyssisolibacter fermentans]
MIISASRRTDIPAYYSEWLINRLKEGFLYVKNPWNRKQCSKIILNPEVVDCIVFWTKNAQPMLDKLDIIDAMKYSYYFQFTLTPYGKNIEKGLPPKNVVVDTFRRLSDKIGPHRVVWRYDPVIINEKFSVQYHIDTYGKMCNMLRGYTNKCIFSFIDLYAKIRNRTKGIVESEVSDINMNKIADGFSKIAKSYGIELSTCSEVKDLSKYGITHASCIDKAMIENIIGCPIKAKKDVNQRHDCGCIESIDIGAYDCCGNGCVYCYANANQSVVMRNMKKHNDKSPILIGNIDANHVITERKVKSFKILQTSMFSKNNV